MAKGKRDIFIVPLFIPTQGCPFRCIYCKQESITGVKRPIPLKEMEEILSKAINSKGFYSAAQREIAFFGGTFTGLDHEDKNQLLQMAKPFIERGYFHNIRISTRPDLIRKDTLEFLKKAHVKTIEIGVQSFDDMVLETSLRGYTRETVLKKAELIKEKGFLLGIQLMVGLPNESEDTFMEGVKIAISLRPAFVRLYPTIVLKGTQLAGLYHKGKYRPLPLEEAIGLCSWAICQFEESGIRVIRVGLHNLPSLREEIVAGPFHESFG
ncbi:MAG: elongator complex protein 3, partial [Desulfatiglandales bacterium]